MGEKVAAAALEDTSEYCNSLLEKTSEGCCSSLGPRAVAPCLVRRCGTPFDYVTVNRKESCSLYNILKPDKENCREFIPELSGTTIYQKPSHQGWLIILCRERVYDYTPSSWKFGDCFLWNPVTKETIQLPSLLDCCVDGHINDCVLSSPPRSDAYTNPPDNGNDDSIVFVFYEFADPEQGKFEQSFLFCRPGETHWRVHKLSRDIMDLLSNRAGESLLCFKGKLYLMCTDDDHVDEHLDYHLEIECSTSNTDLTVSIKPFHVKKEVLFPLIGGRKHKYRMRYVASHDELFRVDTIRIGRRFDEVISIEVVRLNFSLMEWEKVNSIGNHVLFLGSRTTTGCCSAAELGFTSCCLLLVFHNNPSLYKFEIESTGYTITLPRVWPTEFFDSREWVIMPVNVLGRVENMLGKDEEIGFLIARETETCTTMVTIDETGQVEAASCWNNLNEDIVRFIANQLHGSDYKNFRSVCQGNRAIMPKIQAASYLSPWLLFSRHQDDNIHNVLNPMYNDENYAINLYDLAGCTICFQKGGWLLLTRRENILFYNPFTRETVRLPDINIKRGDFYSVVCFSSLPTCSDCVVFVMDERPENFCINFIRRGESHWSSCIFDKTYIEERTSVLNTAVFHNGAFFCVNYLGTLDVFSAKDKSWTVLGKPHEQFDYYHFQGYLVECAGDLLLVQVKIKYPGKMSVKIFKLNFSEMKWEKVESLGEHMLFISHTSCVLVVAPNSYMKNKIYFPRLHLNGNGIVFYSLETDSYHSVGSQHSATNLYDTKGWLKNCTWIEPNRMKSTSEELDWFKTPS